MANAFTKAQFMEPPGAATGPTPIGAVKAGDGIAITADGVISTTRGGGTINNIICTNGIQGGGGDPQVFIGLLPPTDTTIGGVYTVDGSGISIDSNGLIRSTLSFGIQAGPGIVLTNVTPESATITAAIAGTTTATRGSIFVDPSTTPGVQVSAAGALSLTPPIGDGIGGVKAGPGCSIDPITGVITATGSGGTITAVGAGTGLGGGGTTGAVSLFLKPPSGTTIGGVYGGQNVTIDADGRLSVVDAALGVLTVNGAEPIFVTGTATDPIVNVRSASTTEAGVVQLTNSLISTSQTEAPTAAALTTVYDDVQDRLPLAGGTMAGVINFTAGQTFPGTVDSAAFTQLGGILVGDNSPVGYAQLPVGSNGQVLSANSAAPLGVEWSTVGTGTVTTVTGVTPVQVANGSTTPEISVDAASTTSQGIVQLYDGTDSTSTTLAATANSVKTTFDLANSALPLAGGTMVGDITFSGTQSFPGVMPLGGGTFTGAVTFNAGQTFPGVLADGSISGTGALEVGGTPSNPVLSVDTATTAQLGVVQPDGTTITIDGNGVISAVAAAGGTLQSVTDAGATTTNPIVVDSGSYSSTIGTQTIEILQAGTGGENFTLSNNGADASLVFGNRTFATAGLYFDSLTGTTLSTWDSLPVNINAGYNLVVTTNDGGGPTYTMGIDHFTIDNGGAIIDGNVQIINGSSLSVEGELLNQGLTYPTGDGTAGQFITTDGAGILGWATPNVGIADSLFTAAGSLISSSAANTPTELTAGANGTILAVNSGLPAWRTPLQLGLLSSTAAAATYAPLDNPTFTGPVTVNAGGAPGSNALIVSGGNLVLATSFTPTSSSSTGSIGELAWDSQYLYFCYAPNTWGRVAVDLTPF